MKKGFTLVEILVVVMIIGILAAISMPNYINALERSRGAEALTTVKAVAEAIQRAEKMRGQLSAGDWKYVDVTPQGTQSGTTYTTQYYNYYIKTDSSGSYVSAERIGKNYGIEIHVHAGDILPPVCVYTANDTNAEKTCRGMGFKTAAAHVGTDGKSGLIM